MDNETNTPPQTNYPTSEEREAEAAAARRIIDSQEPTPNYNARRAVVALGVGGALIAAVAGGQAIQREVTHEQQVASITAEYKHDQNILHAIETKALEKVDPASVVGIFTIAENTDTINELSNKLVDSQTEYKKADQATKEWIDFTILESGKAQGSYDVNDTFVVSHATIDGKDTLIVQDGESIQNSEKGQELLFKPIENITFTINSGESVIGVAQEKVKQYFTTHNLDMSAIPSEKITEQGKQAAEKMQQRTGKSSIQPGETFDLTIGANKLGQYDIIIDPLTPAAENDIAPNPIETDTQLATLSDPTTENPSFTHPPTQVDSGAPTQENNGGASNH